MSGKNSLVSIHTEKFLDLFAQNIKDRIVPAEKHTYFPSCNPRYCAACSLIYKEFIRKNSIYAFNHMICLHKMMDKRAKVKEIFNIYSYYCFNYKLMTFIDRMYTVIKDNIYILFKVNMYNVHMFDEIKSSIKHYKLDIVYFDAPHLKSSASGGITGYIIIFNTSKSNYNINYLSCIENEPTTVFSATTFKYEKNELPMHLSITLPRYITTLIIEPCINPLIVQHITNKINRIASMGSKIGMPLFIYYSNDTEEINLTHINLEQLKKDITYVMEMYDITKKKYVVVSPKNTVCYIKHFYKETQNFIDNNKFNYYKRLYYYCCCTKNKQITTPDCIVPYINFNES